MLLILLIADMVLTLIFQDRVNPMKIKAQLGLGKIQFCFFQVKLWFVFQVDPLDPYSINLL